MMNATKTSIVVATLLTLVLRVNVPAYGVAFTEQLLSNQYTYAYGLAAGDLTADGRPDIVSSNATSRSMYYYQNNGGGSFTRNTIESNDQGILERMAIGNVGGDSRPDVVVVNNQIGFPPPWQCFRLSENARRDLLVRERRGAAVGPSM